MSDPKNFLTRWSRRKREAAENPPSPLQGEVKGVIAPAVEFDPATLPSIESIGAGSDIRAFLQRGVPPSLTRAALRRAWAADPAIRDFIGLSENAWDFNAPDSIPGFGSLDHEDIRRLAAQLFSEPGAPEAPHSLSSDRNPLVQSASAPGEPEFTTVHEMRNLESEGARPDQVHELQKPENDAEETSLEGPKKVDVATQYEEKESEYDKASLGARHGGALPE